MGKITINELHKSLFDYVQAVSDDKLETRDKTIVGAINELFSDSVDESVEINNLTNEISNGKQLIADSIGEPLTATDTFTKMSNDINGLLSTFKTNMMNNGVTVESGDKFKQLIEKIQGLTEGEKNKGIQFAEGSGEWITESVSNDYRVTIPTNLDFMPTYIFCFGDFIFNDNIYEGEEYVNNMLVSNIEVAKGKDSGATMGIIDITPESFTVDGYYKYNSGYNASRVGKATIKRWFAIGVGEDSVTTEEDGALIKEGSLTDLGVTNEGEITYSERGLNFTPSLVYATLTGVTEENAVMETMHYNAITLNSRNTFTGTSEYNTIKIKIVENGFDIILEGAWLTVNTVSYLAIGPIIKIMVDSTDNPTV